MYNNFRNGVVHHSKFDFMLPYIHKFLYEYNETRNELMINFNRSVNHFRFPYKYKLILLINNEIKTKKQKEKKKTKIYLFFC